MPNLTVPSTITLPAPAFVPALVTNPRNTDRGATAALGTIATRQLGLLTRSQCLEHLSRRRLEHRLATRAFVPVRPGVYRVNGAPGSWHQEQLAACLAAGPPAVASFRAAAALWELPGFPPGALELTVPRPRVVRLDGVVAHQSQVWGPDHVTRHRGVPVTSPARTICDLSAVASMTIVSRALDDALRRGLTTIQQVDRVFAPMAHRGRHRGRVIRALIEQRSGGFDPGESPAEERIVRWLTEAGLPRPVQQHRVTVGDRILRLDAAYPDLRIAIEYDGWDAHRTRTRFDSDRARGNELEIRGWMVLRFTSASTCREVVEATTAARRSRPSMLRSTPPDVGLSQHAGEGAWTPASMLRSTPPDVGGSRHAGDQAMQSAPSRTRSSA